MAKNDSEFLRAIHEEKIRTQNERTKLVTGKLTFITVLFGISTANLGIDLADLCNLLYFIPLIALSYDLYIMSADSRIKRIGIYLSRHPASLAGNAEKEWEKFCSSFRDGLASSANMLFSLIVTLSAAVFIHSQKTWANNYLRLWFAVWFVISMALIINLWMRHNRLIESIGDYEPLENEGLMGHGSLWFFGL